MRELLTILIILTSLTTLTAQSAPDSLILTKEQHDKWILKVEKEVKSKQLDLIRRRILLDTNIYIPRGYADGIKFDHEKARGMRTYGYGRPILVFNGYVANINNDTKNKSVIELADLINDKYIKKITIIKDGEPTSALYGYRATYGIFFLTTKNKRAFKKIKKIKFPEF